MHSCDSGSSSECQWLVSTTAACSSRPSQRAVLLPTPPPASLSSCCPLQWRFAEIMYRRAPSSSRSSTPSTPDADVERVVLFVVDPWAVAAPNPASVSALSAAQQAAAGARGTRAWLPACHHKASQHLPVWSPVQIDALAVLVDHLGTLLCLTMVVHCACVWGCIGLTLLLHVPP